MMNDEWVRAAKPIANEQREIENEKIFIGIVARWRLLFGGRRITGLCFLPRRTEVLLLTS